MKIPGVDVDRQVQQAMGPFLERLDGLQATLNELLALEQARDAEKARREQRGEQP